MKINTKSAIFLILLILACSYFYDFDMFKSLLTWLLGGAIVLLLNIAFFGDLIKKVMENADVQDFIKLFKEAKEHLKALLENHNH